MRTLTLAPVFSDNVVFQRDKPIRLWGTASAPVRVYLAGHEALVEPQDGSWLAELPPLSAVEEVDCRVCSAGEEIILANAAVGEVWIAGGQSNMEWPLRYDADRREILPAANDRLLRFFDQPHLSYEGHEAEGDFSGMGFWRTFSPENAPWFSAVGAYFAGDLRKALGVPVGIVGCNWGGSSASCWMPEEALASTPRLRRYLEDYRRSLESLNLETYAQDYRKSLEPPFPPEFQETYEKFMLGEVSFREMMEEGKKYPPPPPPLPVGPMSPFRPGALWKYMLKKIAPLSVRGVLWYQGEADHAYPQMYGELLTAMIRSWRELFQDQLPFLVAQLPGFKITMFDDGFSFPEIRAQQALTARTVPGVHLCCIIDLGEEHDIHPRHKRPVGQRLALLARARIYGENLLCESPEPEQFIDEADGMRIVFKNAGEGLSLKGENLTGLEAYADNGSPLTVNFRIEGNTLRVFCPRRITKLYYAWEPYIEISLYNSTGLPVAPFRYVRNS
ncbi:MAG: sialate O-acetylesterase [Treponema sp.]|jgi:sialate O-acetylesterase|nr:sialate O-acetylesterase [Treponema sp.]